MEDVVLAGTEISRSGEANRFARSTPVWSVMMVDGRKVAAVFMEHYHMCRFVSLIIDCGMTESGMLWV